MRNYIYYLLLLVLSLSCTSNKRKIDKNTQLGKLAYTNVNGTNLKNDSTIWGMKVDLVTDNRLIIQELSNELLYGVYRVEGEKLIKEGGFLTKGVGPFEMIHPDLWGNEGDSVFYI